MYISTPSSPHHIRPHLSHNHHLLLASRTSANMSSNYINKVAIVGVRLPPSTNPYPAHLSK